MDGMIKQINKLIITYFIIDTYTYQGEFQDSSPF